MLIDPNEENSMSGDDYDNGKEKPLDEDAAISDLDQQVT